MGTLRLKGFYDSPLAHATITEFQSTLESRAHHLPAAERNHPDRGLRVAEIADDTTARDFVITHHYSRSVPAMRFRSDFIAMAPWLASRSFLTPVRTPSSHGLSRSPPGALSSWDALCLLTRSRATPRLIFLRVPLNWSGHMALKALLVFQIRCPGATSSARLPSWAHTGIIYQAFNGVYLGRGTARTLRLLPDGRAFNDQSIQKIRKMERGWRSAAAVLEDLGAPHAPEEPEARLNWLHSALSGFTRTVRYHGCHQYAWALTRPLKRILPPSLPFPKFVDAPL